MTLVIDKLAGHLQKARDFTANVTAVGAPADGSSQQLTFYAIDATAATSQIGTFFKSLQDDFLMRGLGTPAHSIVQTGPLRHSSNAGDSSIVGVGSSIALDGLPFDGKAGAIVTDDGGDRYILSCRHVLDGNKGDRVVLRQAGADDRWVARLTQVSAWNLGIQPQPPNKTDFSLARILDDVASNPALPPGVLPFACDIQPPSPNLPVAPLSNTGYHVSVSRQVPLSNVQFPFGQIALSGMWLAHSPDPSVDLAESGDSGSLFVFVGQDRLYPAAIAVAVSAEYRVWDHETRTLGKDCGPAVLLCPVDSIVGEITKLKIRFCKCATHPPVAMASQAAAAQQKATQPC